MENRNCHKTLYCTNRKDWRSWLEKNFDKEEEIWLVFPKKSSGKPRISYNNAVEEALCFGWIDSTIKTFNEESSIQRFSPRRAKSSFSQANRERLKWLVKENLLHPSVQDIAKNVLKNKFIFPQDILEAIKSNKIVWRNYQKYSPSYRRIRVAYIEAARKRPEEFEKRLANFIKKTKENKQIGFGGIEKYY
ncbi:MAG: YdeI/OmpD-associated family protein [Candidatus Aminicenantes bacterium]|nr:YdeI/OmpD-associated family protein [Candidatus Aminicenantes bacterium]